MNLNRELNMQQVRLWGMAIVLTVGGLVLAGKSIYEAVNSMIASGWPTADASIAHAELKSKEAYRARFKTTSTTYDVDLRYRYEVDGQEYIGRRITFGQVNRSSESDAKALLAKYPVGRNVTIHYNADNPADSVLESGAPGTTWMVLVIGVLMFLGGGWFIKTLAKAEPPAPSHRSRGRASAGAGRKSDRETGGEAGRERDATADALDHLG